MVIKPSERQIFFWAYYLRCETSTTGFDVINCRMEPYLLTLEEGSTTDISSGKGDESPM
jgi:hypothetical protein